jgi:hypothetical protein
VVASFVPTVAVLVSRNKLDATLEEEARSIANCPEPSYAADDPLVCTVMFASKRKGLFVAWIEPKAADVMLTGVMTTPDPQPLTWQNFAFKLMVAVEDAGVEYTPFKRMRSVLFNDSHCIGYPITQDIKF